MEGWRAESDKPVVASSQAVVPYEKALAEVHDYQRKIYGGFYKPLPDLKSLPREETQKVLLERAQEMLGHMEKNEVSVFEFSRFSQEFDVICLMLLIAVWGGVVKEIPLSIEEIGIAKSAIHDLCTAGYSEPGQEVHDVVRSLLLKTLESREFPPDAVRFLLDGTK